ncbi:MAG TPA: hypothetical protein VH413_06150 [Verrucomicrobiae bacterium]|jgi:hypothetical protein|nr:hypothetical protein [Verrucomicrobiae bacterium]
MLRFTLTLGLLGTLAAASQAGTLVPSGEAITTSVQREQVDTVEPFYRAYLTTDAEKFAFLMPDKYRLGGDPAHGKLLLENMEKGGMISFTFMRSSDSDPAETGRDAYRQLLASRYPKAKFVGEFSTSAGGHSGDGFEFQWVAPNGLVEKTRAVYLHTNAGLLELISTRSATNAPEAQNSLDEIIHTFAASASANGQLVVHHIARSN